MLYVGSIVDGEVEAVEPLDLEDEDDHNLDAAVEFGVDNVGGDFSVIRGDDSGPDETIAYYSAGYGTVYIVDLALWSEYHASGSSTIGGKPFALDPESMRLGGALLLTAERGLPYPAEIANLDNFDDISYGNDSTDRVRFTIGTRMFVLWVSPARVTDRRGDLRDVQWQRFELQSVPFHGDIEESMESFDAGSGVEVLSTEDARDLIASIRTIEERPQRRGRVEASARDQLATAMDAMGPYNGWQFSLEYPGTFTYSHPNADAQIMFTPEHDAPDVVQVQVGTSEGEFIEGGPDHPFTIKTAANLFSIVKPWLDKYQPTPKFEDPGAARARMIEFDAPHGPRRAEAEDDSAKRFGLLELNPCDCHRNPIGGSCEFKDYDIVICDEGDPALDEHNPPGEFTDRHALWRGQAAVKEGVGALNGSSIRDRVARVIAQIPVRYNSRLTSSVARTMFGRSADGKMHPKRIEFSALVKFPDADALHQTVVHEYCHAARSLISSDYRREDGHGREWKALMSASGAVPSPKNIFPEISTQILTAKIDRKLKRAAAKAVESMRFGGRLPPAPGAKRFGPMFDAAPREHDPVRASFKPGDRVSFLDDKGNRLKGEVLSCNKKRVVIDADGFEWGIGPAHVSREPGR